MKPSKIAGIVVILLFIVGLPSISSAQEANLVLDQDVSTHIGSLGGISDNLTAQTFTVGIGGFLSRIEVQISGAVQGTEILFAVIPVNSDGSPVEDWHSEALSMITMTLDDITHSHGTLRLDTNPSQCWGNVLFRYSASFWGSVVKSCWPLQLSRFH